jgi:hypothetical protein
MMNPSFKCVLTAMLDDNMGVTHTEVRPKNPRWKATDQAETGAIGYLPPQMLGQNTPQEPVEAGRSRGLPPVNWLQSLGNMIVNHWIFLDIFWEPSIFDNFGQNHFISFSGGDGTWIFWDPTFMHQHSLRQVLWGAQGMALGRPTFLSIRHAQSS